MKDYLPYAHVVTKASNLMLLLLLLLHNKFDVVVVVTQKYEIEVAPHVKHNYLSSFNQRYSCFVILVDDHVVYLKVVGTLSKTDDDGYENVV